ncbi:unnamed protein product [Blepharisma stoltei]|uniref:Photosystem I assembly protein Ycf4 n=1 Tax=Blepharisma stoltei TaxID=1481888 RepID=A0AAU9IFH3_9CILI|nr:unnamed protein product [Blepharisma stoltei]
MQRPYNYHRMNLWLIISYLAILWSFILSTLYWIIKFDSIILWLALQHSGFFIFIAVGIAIQCKWCPSLLYTEKPVDIAVFFKFSLGSKIAATEINQMKRTLMEVNSSSKMRTSIIDSPSIIYNSKADMISE